MSSTAVAMPQPVGVIASLAAKYGMHPTRFEETLRATVVPEKCSPEEFAAFLLVAREYGLNPILREIYAFPKKGGGIQPIVGVDGWAAMINREPAFDGMEFRDEFDSDGKLVSITCRMHRKDRAHPIEATEYLAECARPGDVWQRWPRRMLRHKAMIQCARYAFGFSGIVDPDEIDRFGAVQHDPAMLRAEMQLANEPAEPANPPAPITYQIIAGEEDQRPAEEIGELLSDPDYRQGRRDAKYGISDPPDYMGTDEARVAKWVRGKLDAMDEKA